jgi:DNA-binding transcriptional LysR family regulator
MELRELRTFAAIVEERSFRLAADRLHQTPSALSHQIGRLEREMSQALLVRATGGVYPTSAGEVILDLARKIFSDIKSAREQLGLPGESEREKLRVTGTSVGLTYIYGELCEQYMRSNAHIELEIMAAETTELASTRVVRGEADLAFTTLPTQSKALDMVPIGRAEQVFIVGAGHPLAKSKKVTLDEICLFPFVRYLKGSAGRLLSDRLFGARQYPPMASETNDTEVVKRIVKLGFATGLVPVFTIGQELAAGEIKPLRLSSGSILLDFGLVFRKKDDSTKVREFLAFCSSLNDKGLVTIKLENAGDRLVRTKQRNP